MYIQRLAIDNMNFMIIYIVYHIRFHLYPASTLRKKNVKQRYNRVVAGYVKNVTYEAL